MIVKKNKSPPEDHLTQALDWRDRNEFMKSHKRLVAGSVVGALVVGTGLAAMSHYAHLRDVTFLEQLHQEQSKQQRTGPNTTNEDQIRNIVRQETGTQFESLDRKLGELLQTLNDPKRPGNPRSGRSTALNQ